MCEHVQDGGIADMFESDETVAFDEGARMIGRMDPQDKRRYN